MSKSQMKGVGDTCTGSSLRCRVGAGRAAGGATTARSRGKNAWLDAGFSKREVLDLLVCYTSARWRFWACPDCSQRLL